ncbi:hypothetical protein LWI28_016108 [Acer negundo]|uniref:WRKY domain-containing protein n=1 Tax=Acer negundo TaxID=4023 RepID=A0AAD5IEE1_ACENE|nr:hypothetical protein LWI28_016108 [Acer negundo]
MGNWDSYRDDLDALKIELEKLFEVRNDVMIRRVRIAEEEEQQMMKPTDEVVQLWLSKVQAVETEVDDLIRQISQETEELHPGGFCFRNLLNMPSSYEFEDSVADKLQAIMNLITEGASVVADDEARVVTIPKDGGALEIEEFVSENLPEDVPYDEGTIVGMESIFTKVWRCLEEGGGEGGGYVGIIGLYGMGGVGKTTLLKQIYRNMLDNYGLNNFAVVIWVSVSKELRLEKIQEKIGMKIGLFDKVWKNKNFEEKASDILKILEEKKFVLFMDELWERVDLTKVGVPFPNPENSSKIVFTTRSLEICRLMEADRQFKMNCLSEEEAWKLFETLVGDETLHPEQVFDIARDISKECSGLPLALVSIGRALAGNKTPQEWRDVLGVLTRSSQSTSSISDSNDQLKKGIYNNLKSSYDHLQNDMFKSCLLYCCLFPRNDKISKGHLIDCWIGEGFLDDRLGAQSQGYHIIDVLLSACLLEEEEDDNYVKMHNWIHDMSLWIATETEVEKNFFVCTDAGLTEPPEIEKWVNMTRISMTKNGFTNLENAPMCSHLQTLFLNKNIIKMIGSDFFRFMRCLKVLNLSDNELLELPSEITNLVSLQHLDLSRTAIKSLPNQLGALKKLKCLNLEDTSQLYAIPPLLISTLSVLHVLRLQGCGFLDQSGEDSVVCKDAQLLIEELFCLKNLSMLSIGLRNSHALQKLLSSYRLQSCIQSLWLHSLQHPKSIVISISYMNHLKTLKISECEYLEELEVDFVGEAHEQAISNFYFLDEVIIESCPNLQDLTWLILAPNLKHLEISQCSELEEIIKVWKLSECPELMRNLTPFLKLHFIKLSNLPNLRSIYWCDLLFPDLKDRIITECPKLQISLPPHRFNKDHSKEKITVNVPSGSSGMLVQKIVSSFEKEPSMLMNSNSSTSTSTLVVPGSADHQQPAVGDLEQNNNSLIIELRQARELARLLQLHLIALPSSTQETCEMLVQKTISSYEKSLSMLMNSNSSTSTSTLVVPGSADHQQPAVGDLEQNNNSLIIEELRQARELARLLARLLQLHLIALPSSTQETCEMLVQKTISSYEKSLSMLMNSNSSTSTSTLVVPGSADHQQPAVGDLEQNNNSLIIEELRQGRDLVRLLQLHLIPLPSSTQETCEMLVQKTISSYEKSLSMLMNSNSSTSTSVVPGGADHQQPAVGVAAAAQPTYGAGLGVEFLYLGGEDSDRNPVPTVVRKRKATNRSTHVVRVNPATGLEGTLDDGFSWRKYGQKDILGAKHPRGYYRCTHRLVQGCLATKQVQRSDEDPMILEITYHGSHTCIQASKTANNPPENQEPTNMTTSLLEYSQQSLLQYSSGSSGISYQQQQQQHPEFDESEKKVEPHLEVSDEESEPPHKRLYLNV